MKPLEITRSGILATVAVFVAAAVCVRLGLWQLDRRDARLTRNAAVAERMAEPAVDLAAAPLDTTGLVHRRARLQGTYDSDRALVLAGRSRSGSPGVHVYAPLRPTGGPAILVNRGWLPSRDAATVDLAPVRVDTAVAVEGVLMPFPEVEVERPASGFRTTWFRFDGDAVREQYPYPVAPLYLLARPGPAGPPETGPLPADGPELGAGPHLSYALQWFSFAAILIVGWVALVVGAGVAARASSPAE